MIFSLGDVRCDVRCDVRWDVRCDVFVEIVYRKYLNIKMLFIYYAK